MDAAAIPGQALEFLLLGLTGQWPTLNYIAFVIGGLAYWAWNRWA